MKKMTSITVLLLALIMTGFVSCSSEEDIESYKGYISEDSLEVICENVELATKVAGDAFVKCKTIQDVNKYIDDIKKCESIEDVLVDNHAMYVKVKGFGSIPYIFKPEVDNPADELFDEIERLSSTRAGSNLIIHHQLENKKACVVNQLLFDERDIGKESRRVTSLTEKMFSTCGYIGECDIKLTVDFYKNKIYDYDMVFIITHGIYDSNDGLHWLMTTEECDKQTDEDKKDNGLTKAWVHEFYEKHYKSFSKSEVKVGSVPEIRDGEIGTYYYLIVSEKLISNSNKRFGEEKTPIIFNAACESLKQNDNLAKAFIGQGAKAYYGYDESNSCGHYAGWYIWSNLTVGRSLSAAYDAIPEKYRNEKHDKYTAHLLHHFDESNDYEHSCIEHPTLTDVIGFSESDGGFVTLKAKIREYYSGKDPIIYGFSLGESDNPEEATVAEQVKIREDEGCYRESHIAYFEKKFYVKDLKPETTYYCWAFISDGQSLCFSNTGSFETPKRFTQVVPDDIRKTMDPYITIYDGNNPPNIEGRYIMDPPEIVFDNTGSYKAGDYNFNSVYFRISNQNTVTNTLDYEEKEIGNGIVISQSYGKGAFISGEGNNFSVFFNTTGVTHIDGYSVNTTHALVLSGTKESKGISNLRYAFVIVDKDGDINDKLMDKGDFRVFKDRDGWSEFVVNWPTTRSSTIRENNDSIITPWSIYSIR